MFEFLSVSQLLCAVSGKSMWLYVRVRVVWNKIASHTCLLGVEVYDDAALADREVRKWHCVACYTEACRDAKKQVQSVTNGQFCSAVHFSEARKQYRKESTMLIR